MPIRVFWDNEEQTIVRSEGEGHWTWEEYHDALSQVVHMIQAVDHRVDLITTALPGAVTPGGSTLPHFQRAMRLMPDNFGMNIIVSDTTFGRLMVNMFSKVYATRMGADIRMAPSLEHARAMIAEDRSSRGNYDAGSTK